MTYPPGPANSGYTPQHTPAVPLPDTSTGWYLNPPTPPPPPPKRWPGWKIALLVGALVSPVLILGLILAALDDETEKPTAGIGSPAPYDAAPDQKVPPSAKDSAGAKACAAVKASNGGPSPFSQEPAAMAAIAVDGKQSTNPFIRAASEKLAAAAKEAVDARGTADEPIQGIKMGTAALNLETTCTEQWYYPRS